MAGTDVTKEGELVKYELDLSKLTVKQMKEIIYTVCTCYSIGDGTYHTGDCKLCEACEMECWERARREGNAHLGVEIARCG